MNDYEQQASFVDVTPEVADALCEIEELVSGPQDKATQRNLKVKYRSVGKNTCSIQKISLQFYNIGHPFLYRHSSGPSFYKKDAFTQCDKELHRSYQGEEQPRKTNNEVINDL